MPTIIEIKNLQVKYGATTVLENINFNINKGDYVGLAGPNGAGKSTLIKAILGLIPSQGEIIIASKKAKQFNHFEKIGYLPQKGQNFNQIFPATVAEVVALGTLSKKKWPKKIKTFDRKKTEEILKKLGIFELKNRPVGELSGGEQQRVFLARALVNNPEILILDEPSTALDPSIRESFFELINKLNKESGVTIILITHDIGHIGAYAKQLLYLDKKIVFYGAFTDFCHSKNMGEYFGDFAQHLICDQH